MTHSKALPKPAITYPYMPAQAQIVYVPADNPFMTQAKAYARQFSLDKAMPNASVIVQDGIIIGQGANGSDYHEQHGCERVRLHIPTGQGYELCEGCHPKNHSEPKAITDALKNSGQTKLKNADIYLWGHWWCCEPCWQAMLAQDIRQAHLLEASDELFNRDSPKNIIGHQFSA